jgi:GntR family transcriptional regulator/MocR family aminotransferase
MELDVVFQTGIPLRRQLEDALRVAIRSGRLTPGAVLPPSRDLAQQLGVSRGVVVSSYAQLAAEGYLAARRGSATRVARLPETVRPALRARGSYELRNAIAGYLARMRGVVVEPDQVVVCCAASQALTVIWDVLRRRGVRRVAIEDPGWRWQRYTAEHAGLEVVPVRVDADGLVVSELAAAGVDAVVITPAHQYPTGVVMTAERRSALLAWAHQRQALIIEDDYDVEYRFGREPVASLQGLAPDRVVFVGTTSKTLAPALRLAWMVPPAGLIDEVEDMLRITGVVPPTLDQAALAFFISDAALERHLRSMRRRYRVKRDILVDALHRYLPEARVQGTAAGLHLLAQLPDGADERAIGLGARDAGVIVHELHRHCTTVAPYPPALLLGFALPAGSDLTPATRLLAGVVHGGALASRS